VEKEAGQMCKEEEIRSQPDWDLLNLKSSEAVFQNQIIYNANRSTDKNPNPHTQEIKVLY